MEQDFLLPLPQGSKPLATMFAGLSAVNLLLARSSVYNEHLLSASTSGRSKINFLPSDPSLKFRSLRAFKSSPATLSRSRISEICLQSEMAKAETSRCFLKKDRSSSVIDRLTGGSKMVEFFCGTVMMRLKVLPVTEAVLIVRHAIGWSNQPSLRFQYHFE